MKGRTHAPESIRRTDPATGASVRQVTTHPSIHHHPFYCLPAYDDAMEWLVFVSHRTGRPQIFLEERASGRLVQLTDRDDVNEWSVHPSHDGRHVYFTAGCGAWRVATGSGLGEECLGALDVVLVGGSSTRTEREGSLGGVADAGVRAVDEGLPVDRHRECLAHALVLERARPGVEHQRVPAAAGAVVDPDV